MFVFAGVAILGCMSFIWSNHKIIAMKLNRQPSSDCRKIGSDTWRAISLFVLAPC
jgi:hypothetical protein